MVGCMPSPLRMIASTLRTKRNLTPKAVIKRLSDDSNRLALVEDTLASWFQVTTQGSFGLFVFFNPEVVQKHLMPLSLFGTEFSGAAAAAMFNEDLDETEDNLGVLLQYSMVRMLTSSSF